MPPNAAETSSAKEVFPTTLKGLISESTAHGIPSMVSTSTTRSLLWLCTFICCASLFSKQSFTLVTQYLANGMTVTVAMVPEQNSQFPRVTLCSHNMINSKSSHKTSYKKLELLNNVAAWDIYFQYCQQLLSADPAYTWIPFNEIQTDSQTPMKCLQPDSELIRFSKKLNFEPILCNERHLFEKEVAIIAIVNGYADYSYSNDTNYRSEYYDYYNYQNPEATPEAKQTILNCIFENDQQVREALSSSVWTQAYMRASAKDYSDVIELFRTADLESVNSSGLQLDSFVVECHYKLMPCKKENFIQQQTDSYGNCFTFVAPEIKSLPFGSFPSYHTGLDLTVRIANEENAELLTSSSGIRIAAHDRLVSHGVIEDEGVSASLGRESMIQFSKRILKRGTERKLGCVNSWPHEVGEIHGVNYDRKLCHKFCKQHALVAKCRCTVSLLYRQYHSNISFCQLLNNATQYTCWKEFENPDNEQRIKTLAECETYCQPACTEIKHDLLLSQFWYPNINSAATEIMRLYMMVTDNKEARQEMNQYLDLACKSAKAANNISSCFGQNCAKSFQCLKRRGQEYLIQELPKYSELFKRSNQLFRERYARIYVFHDEEEYELIEESIEVPLVRTLSEIGGVLGLWVGLSVMTIVEFFEILFHLVREIATRVHQRNVLKTNRRQASKKSPGTSTLADDGWNYGCAIFINSSATTSPPQRQFFPHSPNNHSHHLTPHNNSPPLPRWQYDYISTQGTEL